MVFIGWRGDVKDDQRVVKRVKRMVELLKRDKPSLNHVQSASRTWPFLSHTFLQS